MTQGVRPRESLSLDNKNKIVFYFVLFSLICTFALKNR